MALTPQALIPQERYLSPRREIQREQRDKWKRLVIAWLADGLTVNSFCREHADAPLPGVIFNWMAEDPAFRRAHIAARMLAADIYVDQMIDIADDLRSDPKRAKLMIDTRATIAGFLNPDKYGKKLDVTSAGNAIGDIPKNASPTERIDHILARVAHQRTAPAQTEDEEPASWSVLD